LYRLSPNPQKMDSHCHSMPIYTFKYLLNILNWPYN
jgi:hypothetical protein